MPSARWLLRSAIAAAIVAVSMPYVASSSTPNAESSDPRIVAVGDIACQSLSQGDGEGACRSDEVAALITELAPDRFLPLGDLQYNKGSLKEFRKVWRVQFGHLDPITEPVPGNHEYATPEARGYFRYWGAAGHGPAGYYSYDLGTWHVVALNSEICHDDCGPGSAQYDWLVHDLQAHTDAICTLVYQHHPPFDWRPWEKWVDPDDETPNGGSEVERYGDLWRLMDREGVDVMLVGHNHIYYRWAPQHWSGDGAVDGIRQFTVGTGGRSLYPFGKKPRPENLVEAQRKSFGVLEVTLHSGSYDYRWVGVPTDPAFEDSGTFACA